MTPFDLRIGHGFDVHRLEPGDGVTLGGVFIACPYRLVAHSDGDLVIHALCDAILGACALGDIGKLFPDTDPAYAGADSRRLLRQVTTAARDAGWQVVNVDCTLIAEVPRIRPHVDAMREHMASDLGVTPDRVGMKATTNEQMGSLGRREGLSAHAVALMARV